MKALYIKNGQFYDDNGNVVPITIGDKDQIALLRLYEKQQEEPIDVETRAVAKEIEYEALVNCICGRKVYLSYTEMCLDEDLSCCRIDEEDILEMLYENKISATCPTCNKKYAVKRVKKDSELLYEVTEIVSKR